MSLPICCNIVSFMPRYRSLICQIEWMKPAAITKFMRKLTLERAQCRTLNCVEFNLSIQMFPSGLSGSKLYGTKEKLQRFGPRQYFRQWCNESVRCNCENWKQMCSPKGRRSVWETQHCSSGCSVNSRSKSRPLVHHLPFLPVPFISSAWPPPVVFLSPLASQCLICHAVSLPYAVTPPLIIYDSENQ